LYSGYEYVFLDAAISMNLTVRGYLFNNEAYRNPCQLSFTGARNPLISLSLPNIYILSFAIGKNQIIENVFQFALNKALLLSVVILSETIIS
jgi:hypothetical protein